MESPGAAGVVLALTAWIAACGGSSSPSDSSPGGTIVGNERIGWDQPAGDPAELANFRYALYIDDARREPLAAACDATAGAAGFPCSAPLPPLSAGTHTLQIVTYLADNPALESPRSMALVVTVRSGSVTAGGLGETVAAAAAEAARAAAALPRTQTVSTASGRSFRVDLVAAFEGINALTIAPDGRIFAGDRFGRVRVLDPSAPRPAPVDALLVEDAAVTANGGGVLDVAADPAFTDNRFVYVLDVAAGADGPSMRVSRYREAGARLGERAVLLDRVPAAAEPTGALTFGPDGRLYVAFDAGPAGAPAAGGYSGTLLRLNPDGSAPADQRAFNPVIAGGYVAPRSLRWDAEGAEAWLADPGGRRLESIRVQRRTGVTREGATVAGIDRPAAVAAVRDPRTGANGLVVADVLGGLAVAYVPPADRPPSLASEMLAIEGLGRTRALERAPDGSVLLATDDLLLRINAS